MIATHSIKHDGVWYKVGDEVPESNSNSVPSDFMNPPEHHTQRQKLTECQQPT